MFDYVVERGLTAMAVAGTEPALGVVFTQPGDTDSTEFADDASAPVKLKLWEPSGVACFTTVMLPGKITASAESERSWFPPLPSTSIKRM